MSSHSDADPPVNPYAPVSVDQPPISLVSNAVEIRKRYIGHEASVKSIGTLYLLGSLFLVSSGIYTLLQTGVSVASGRILADEAIGALIFGILILSLGLLQGFAGYALTRLQSWARIVTIVQSAFSLIFFPIGTLIATYFMYLLLSQKGSYLFTDEYKAVMAATPEVKYRTSIFLWGLLALFVLVLLVIVGFSVS